MRLPLIALVPLLALALAAPRAEAAPRSEGPSIAAGDAADHVAWKNKRNDGARKSKSSGRSRPTSQQGPVQHAPAPEASSAPSPQVGPATARPDAGRPDTMRPDAGRPDVGRPDADRAEATARPSGPTDGPGAAGGREPAGNRVPTAYDRGGHVQAGQGPARADRASPGLHGRGNPGAGARQAAHAREVHRVRHTLAAHHRYAVHHRWAWHRPWWGPGRSHVWWHYRHPWWRPSWAFGVFVYPPPYYAYPAYVDGRPAPPPPEVAREVDRTRTFSLGARGGSYLGDYYGSGGFGDFGMGLAARYRATEALGFEVSWLYHDATWAEGTERITQPLSASVELFAFPWSKVNPYVFTGLTWTHRNYQDMLHDRWGMPVGELTVDDTLFGPHGGVGLEFGVGENASVNFEGRITGYFNRDPADPTVPTAMQGTMGFNFYL